MKYAVDITSLRENFPEHFEVPVLLREFAEWLGSKRRGCLGFFRLQSERFSDFYAENGADLHDHFAFFIRDPTGGQVGYWLHEGRATISAPVVFVGSEGELRVVASTLHEFLQRLASASTGVPDLDSREDDDGEGLELALWLAGHSHEAARCTEIDLPNFSCWFENWIKAQREWANSDSTHMQIAEKLRKYVKPNAKPWEHADFDVLLVGTQFKMWHRSFGPKLMVPNEISELEPLFRLIREQRAKKMPERGLWFSAWVTIGLEGGAFLSSNFMDEPQILDERPDIPESDYRLDLSAFPRSKHWLPEWLKLKQ